MKFSYVKTVEEDYVPNETVVLEVGIWNDGPNQEMFDCNVWDYKTRDLLGGTSATLTSGETRRFFIVVGPMKATDWELEVGVRP